MDVEERTRQMKLKMNKYKQGSGSDSRLEQDYNKVIVVYCYREKQFKTYV